MADRVHTSVLQKGPGYTATSTTSVTIAGSGSVTLTTQTGLAYSPGARVRASYTVDPTKYMEGLCTAYNTATGALTFTADTSASSGTFATWNINLGGNPGSASFTPWTSNCNAAGFSLTNLGGLILNAGALVGIGIATPAQSLSVLGTFGTASLTHATYATASFGYTGGTELDIVNEISTGFPIILQTRHTSADGSTFPLSINPLGGNVGIGTKVPTAPLQVVGLTTYASDAAAGTGGLTAGAFYKDSGGGLHVKL